MKLHLPTALFALAVLPAVAFAETTYPQVVEDGNNIYINVGKSTDFTAAGAPATEKQKVYLDDKYLTDGKLVLDSGDYVGYFNGTPSASSFQTNLSGTKTSTLHINGDLVISGSAKVNLGGQISTFSCAALEANNVTIAADATGNASALGGNGNGPDAENLNLRADAALFKSLTVNGGSVWLSTQVDNGSTKDGYGANPWNAPGFYMSRSATITDKLEVNGGQLRIGRQPNKGNEEHFGYIDFFYYQSVIGGPIIQTGGNMELWNKTYISGSEITQSGGTMRIAHDGRGMAADYLRFGSDTMVIKQTVSEKNPTGAGATMYLDGIMVKGNNGTESMQVSIIQEGSGTIEMGNGKSQYDTDGKATNKILGSMFTTADDGPASVIKQSGSGTININSDYSSATFNVEQTGKGGNITIGANGKLQSNALTLTDASTFTIASSSEGCGLRLNAGAEVTFAVSSLVSTYTGNTGNTGGLVVEDGGNFTAEGLVSVKVVFSDDVVMAALTELTSAENQVFGTCDGVLIATNVGDAITFQTGASSHTESYTLDDGTVATVEFNYVLTHDNGQLVANSVTATVTSIGTTPAIPEPTTTTLSLLALAGLCARRRRK